MKKYLIPSLLAALVAFSGCQRTLSHGPFGGEPASLPASVADGSVWFLSPFPDKPNTQQQIVIETLAQGEASGVMLETQPGATVTTAHPWSTAVRRGPKDFFCLTGLVFGDPADNVKPYYPFLILRFMADHTGRHPVLAYVWLPHFDRIKTMVDEKKLPGVNVHRDEGGNDLRLEPLTGEQRDWLFRPENFARFVDWENPMIARCKSQAQLATEAAATLPAAPTKSSTP